MRKVLMAKAGTSLAAGQQRSTANMHPSRPAAQPAVLVIAVPRT
jgi:hypothetical protein